MDIPFWELAALLLVWQVVVWLSRVFGLWLMATVIKQMFEGRKQGGETSASKQG